MKREKKRYSDDDLLRVIAASRTIKDCLIALGVSTGQGHYYKEFHDRVSLIGADTSHFDQYFKNKTLQLRKKTPSAELFCSNSSTDRSTIRHRIIKENLLPYSCSECKNVEWMGRPLSLHLDHINGDPLDHRLENLRFLCPNCHSQTPTFSGRNASRPVTNKCVDCAGAILRKSTRCGECNKLFRRRSAKTKISWPCAESIIERIDSGESILSIGATLGVSDNAVRKYLRRRNRRPITQR